MDVARFVDTSGSIPSLKVGALATTLFGTVVYGWLYGFIELVDTVLAGLESIPERFGLFSTSVVTELFDGLEAIVGEAWGSNAAFIGELGALGIIVAIVEVALVLWVVLLVVERLLEFIRVITP